MIRRIILENYMAHTRTVIEPAPGLTVLLGPNNCGKSAVVHALQTLCYNKPADFAVRHGEKEASVTVETDDGHVLTWRRRKDVVSYVIDGREVDRLRGSVPGDLHQYLRMARIDPAGETGAPFLVHFGLQKSPIFLLDDSPARAATFFAASSDAEKLMEMQKRHREKVRDARRDFEKLSNEAANLDRRLDETVPVEPLAQRMEQLEADYRSLGDADAVVKRRATFLTALNAARQRRDHCSRRVAAASPFAAPPTFAETTAMQDRIHRLNQTARRAQREALRVIATEKLPSPPAWVDSKGLQQTIQNLRIAAVRLCEAKSLGASLARLDAPPEPRAQQAEGLQNLLGRMKQCRLRVEMSARESKSAQGAMNAVLDDVRIWVVKHPNCPTCGAATNFESVLEAEHQHA